MNKLPPAEIIHAAGWNRLLTNTQIRLNLLYLDVIED